MHLESQSQNSIAARRYHMKKLHSNSLGLEEGSTTLLGQGDKPSNLWRLILPSCFSTTLQ